jgi:hypothetical protein
MPTVTFYTAGDKLSPMKAGMMRAVRLAATIALLVFFASLCVTPAVRVVTPSELPARLSDQAFWHLVVEMSEAGGYFRSDNLVSNETTYQHVIPELRRRVRPGGVYLGVGPDQNFTYITALRPRVAFIIDVRRQNMLLHLMYKAIIEQAGDRGEFMSMLFSRPKPAGLASKATPEALVAAFSSAPASEKLFEKNLKAITDRLVSHHHFRLTGTDLRSIEYVYRAFFSGGPDLRYSFPRGPWFAGFPTYGELLAESDGEGGQHGYLASDENFRVLRDLERSNLIVPIVGDFGGSKAIRAVGEYLREHNAVVTSFYTSNVEQYLFQGDSWRRFFGNVGALPVDPSSTFIRAYFNNMGYRYQMTAGGIRSATLLDPIALEVAAFNEGRIQSYFDVIERSNGVR